MVQPYSLLYEKHGLICTNRVVQVEPDRPFRLLVANFRQYPVTVQKGQVVAELLPHSFRIPPRGRLAVSDPAMAVSFSAGATVAVQVGVFSLEPMSAARVTTHVVAPTRFVQFGVVIIGGVTAPSGIAVSLVTLVAVIIAASRIAFVAVLARRPVAMSCVFFLERGFCTLRCVSLSARCASSARPIRLSLFSREAPRRSSVPRSQPYRRVREGHFRWALL